MNWDLDLVRRGERLKEMEIRLLRLKRPTAGVGAGKEVETTTKKKTTTARTDLFYGYIKVQIGIFNSCDPSWLESKLLSIGIRQIVEKVLVLYKKEDSYLISLWRKASLEAGKLLSPSSWIISGRIGPKRKVNALMLLMLQNIHYDGSFWKRRVYTF